MALTDNPFIGQSLADLQALQTLYLQVVTDIAKGGRSYSFPGRSFTRADWSDVRQILSDLRVAIGLATGKQRQFAQAVIDTKSPYSR